MSGVCWACEAYEADWGWEVSALSIHHSPTVRRDSTLITWAYATDVLRRAFGPRARLAHVERHGVRGFEALDGDRVLARRFDTAPGCLRRLLLDAAAVTR